MKKTFLALLLCLSVCAFAATGCGSDKNEHALFDRVCPADEALELCKKDDVVVIEDMKCTSGGEVWDAFYRETEAGRPASVLCARYYTLDRDHVSPELYEEQKDQYPVLYFMLLRYDGSNYKMTARDSSLEKAEPSESYKYLMHYTGQPSSPYASFSNYDYYVLVDSPYPTWEEIERGMYSSQWGDYIRHCSIYTNIS